MRCSKKKYSKQCGQVKLLGTMTKWPVQKHTEHNKTRSIKTQQTLRNNYFFVFFGFFYFFFIFSFQLDLLKGLLQKMLNYRLGTVNKKHWGFKPVFRCSKPHTFSTFSGQNYSYFMSISPM